MNNFLSDVGLFAISFALLYGYKKVLEYHDLLDPHFHEEYKEDEETKVRGARRMHKKFLFFRF